MSEQPPNEGHQPPPPPPPEAKGGKKPWWKRWWGITLIVLFALIVLGSLVGDDASDVEQVADDEPTTEQTTSEPAEEDTSEPAVEETTEPAEEVTTEAPPPPAFSEPITLSGNGDDIVPVDIPEDAPAVAHFTHNGSANFQVFLIDDAGNQTDVLINEIGQYDGVRPLNFLQGQAVAEFEIKADGAWTAEISPMNSARLASGTVETTGTGDDVVLAGDGLPGTATRFTHDGQANFQVFTYNGGQQVIINEIGQYDGAVRIPQGTVVIEVVADGNWTMQPR